MKYFFPLHLDGGNRGFEAIAKGTAEILGMPKEDMIGLCTNVELDTRLGLDKQYSLVPAKKSSISFRVRNKIYSHLQNDPDKLNNYGYAYQYNNFLNQLSPDDVMLSTGGDMMCYKNCMANYTVDYLSKKGRKSVLWGCSVGKNNLTKQKIVSLNHFNAVVARESMTEELFKDY